MRSKTPSYILYVNFLGKSNVFRHNVLKKRSSAHNCQGQPAIQVPVPVPVSILKCRFWFHLYSNLHVNYSGFLHLNFRLNYFLSGIYMFFNVHIIIDFQYIF